MWFTPLVAGDWFRRMSNSQFRHIQLFDDDKLVHRSARLIQSLSQNTKNTHTHTQNPTRSADVATASES